MSHACGERRARRKRGTEGAADRKLLLAVGFDVMPRGMLGVFGRVRVVAMGQMRVVRSGFVVALGVVPCGFVVMARSVFVMFRRLLVVLGCLL